MRTLTILGSTGSIGTNTLDVVRRNRERYRIHALVAGQNTDLLFQQIREFRPRVAVTAAPDGVERLRGLLAQSDIPASEWPQLDSGAEARVNVSIDGSVDVLISAIVGVAGLDATYQAALLGKRIGLANKEVLVSGGSLVMEAVARGGAELVPVDSEHNGAHQCLRAGARKEACRLILTASGGPFRNTPASELPFVTPAQALNHPTWRMGNRITIDCATLMNKGFEVIEACWLFGFAPSEVDVVIHPQSTVHAMVEYRDGSVLAQVSATDMRMPIQYALTWPERADAPVPKINWAEARRWEFLPPDFDRFPLLGLAYRAQETGGTATCILNAADEIAVEAFLAGKIGFCAIAELVEETLARVPVRQARSIGEILDTDEESRAVTRALVAKRAGTSPQGAGVARVGP
ncbi:MAG TPA: 1-deoxy-D-xylulose-5-phosphate reductoisomerase [Bryobacteraceae bacterium]|nr:1-deoxy-D-xylulose-5-phosphate reductoisomerase [Bryobacteraceae bacterium]